MAAARCTPEVVWRSQSEPARSVLTLSLTMPSISTPSSRSFNTAKTLLARKRARMAPSTKARRLPIERLLKNMIVIPEDAKECANAYRLETEELEGNRAPGLRTCKSAPGRERSD